MFNRISLFGAAAATTLGLALSACTQSAATDLELATERTETSVKLAPPITTVKPGASVTFSTPTVKPVEIGENGSVVVTVNEGYPSGTLILSATGATGLAVFGASRTMRVDMSNATTHEWRIDFQGETDGVHYINIMATAEPKGGLSETRAHAVRIEVGDWQTAQAKLKSEKDMQMMLSGEAAILLPAEETIE
ncbi:MAG: hypothetical protein NXH72_11380 [Hyphomonadaceae bacterium]|nr:hypothetical protein [Hyphomonadaceae bacterium]